MITVAPGTRAVVFDHDDTLVATIEAKWAQHKHVARTWYGKALSDEELREHWGQTAWCPDGRAVWHR
jgi:phosphoglycolate phosphatase